MQPLHQRWRLEEPIADLRPAGGPRRTRVVAQSGNQVPPAREQMHDEHQAYDEVCDTHPPRTRHLRKPRVLPEVLLEFDEAREPRETRQAGQATNAHQSERFPSLELVIVEGHLHKKEQALPEDGWEARDKVYHKETTQVVHSDTSRGCHEVAPLIFVRSEEGDHEVKPKQHIYSPRHDVLQHCIVWWHVQRGEADPEGDESDLERE
mmetsp:Transcript_19674/g.54001  ORF Transcript_19674/g.54001 Transcript_19674/m.54001 type:complete len:207 (+) Transcript_19674:564-1184(+)